MNWKLLELGATVWASCMLYLYPLKHRAGYRIRVFLATIVAGVITVTGALLFENSAQTAVLPMFMSAVMLLLCSIFIYACAAMPFGATVYCAAWAMITQQIAYELSYILLSWSIMGHRFAATAGLLAVYLIVYGIAGMTIVRYMPEEGTYQIGPRQLTSAIMLLVIFEILFGFLGTDIGFEFRSAFTWNLLLVQCYCVMILYLQNTLFKKSAMKQELDTLNQLWHQQKEQYELSRDTIALINHKCHDLKHQIAAMRAITSPEEREKYLKEIEDSVQIYDSIVKTGNEVLDTVLTEKSLFCAASNIKINCIADGRQMDILDPVDLYTVFGNAIDNAIESVKQLENQEMRMIDVLVYVRRQFLMINIMNPIGQRLEFDGGLPVTTKTRNGYHGFGLKSIRYTVEKYQGFMKIDTAENIFSLKILIPLHRGRGLD